MTDGVTLARHALHDPVHGSVPWAAAHPAHQGPLPVCLFLYGGGGSVETLEAIAPLLEAAWASKALKPMLVACAGVAPFCFYLDDVESGMAWETLVAERLLAAVHARFSTDQASALVGISMGGYGALKIAFARPHVFDAVAAIAPMVEPWTLGGRTPLRNRFHYPPEVPQALLGAERDANLFERDHPAHRAHVHASEIQRRGLAIRLDAASRDACHAHDGAEHLHRALWELDIVHEYHLLRDADHVGESLVPRLMRAFTFVADHLGHPEPVPGAEETALRAALADARSRAADLDATMARTYGLLDPVPRR